MNILDWLENPFEESYFTRKERRRAEGKKWKESRRLKNLKFKFLHFSVYSDYSSIEDVEKFVWKYLGSLIGKSSLDDMPY